MGRTKWELLDALEDSRSLTQLYALAELLEDEAERQRLIDRVGDRAATIRRTRPYSRPRPKAGR